MLKKVLGRKDAMELVIVLSFREEKHLVTVGCLEVKPYRGRAKAAMFIVV